MNRPASGSPSAAPSLGDTATEALADAGGGSDFARLVLVHAHQLRCRSLSFCRNADEARDLVQDTLVRALKHFARLRPDSNIRGWLMTIMANLYRDGLKRRRRSREISFEKWHDVADEPPAPPAHRTIEREQVDAAMAKLPSGMRELIQMKAIEGLRYRDIGERLRIPANTVGTRLRKARRTLFHLLAMGASE